jgi:hypothetical protein
MIKSGFILLTVTMAALIVLIIRYAAQKAWGNDKSRSFTVKMIGFLALWLAYITVISFTGILNSASLPPRIPLLLVLPTFLFVGYFFLSARYKPLIAAMPAGWLVYMQSFRVIVELLLWSLWRQGVLPRSVTFDGYNYEIVIGASALLVGYFGFTKKLLSNAIILLWNIVGLISLAIIVLLFMSHIYNPTIWNDSQNFSLKDFASFPYTLLAGFLMPLAVFLHIFSIVRTRSGFGTNK